MMDKLTRRMGVADRRGATGMGDFGNARTHSPLQVGHTASIRGLSRLTEGNEASFLNAAGKADSPGAGDCPVGRPSAGDPRTEAKRGVKYFVTTAI
jgi:hypothetical protein